MEKNPIIAKRYRWGMIITNSELTYINAYFLKIITNPKIKSSRPCPMSPNMTPNKNGNVTHVKIPGFASLYRETPYVYTIYCADLVKEFV